MAILKSTGVTPTERLLADLCERSFLKLWSYPSPFKDDGKELCDLLAVFGDTIFIFFDRESRILDNSSADPLTAWERWKRKVIDAQIQTAHGAERYIKAGRPIFLDRELKIRFPIRIDLEHITVHKIIVAHGAAEACARFSDTNVYGSLAISYGKSQVAPTFPFMIEIDKSNPVHVFDSHNLPIILRELDTFFDLSQYLDAKLEAIGRFDWLIYCGEEDLLAHYWLNYDSAKKRYLIGPKDQRINGLAIGEGEWKDFIATDIYKRKKMADRESYLWDELIQRTCQNFFEGTLTGNADHSRGQSAIHEMAKEPRFSRRALAAQMKKAIREFPETNGLLVRHMSFMPSYYQNKGYVFLQIKMREDKIIDYDNDYRPKRLAMLEIACAAARNKFSHLTKVIGIAIDAPKFTNQNSEDFILMDCADWTDEQRKHYERANEGFRFFETEELITTKKRITEFPIAPRRANKRSQRGKVGRNEPCPCGSGKKYKRCCL